VPDTLDGRFELIVLHLFLLQQRLRTEAPELARALSEVFFRDMDRSLREIGVSDTGVPRRIKAMAKAYHGRLQAYATQDADALRAALARNLYGTVAEGDTAHLDAIARYMAKAGAALAEASPQAIRDGGYVWADPSGL
jgi:cytochrome b pre-mRNA-processing protein 3